MPFNELSDAQLDALKEISNIGMGHAATALSQLLGERVELRVPLVTVTDITEVPDLLGGPETLVAGITLQILGDARGNVLLIFPRDSANRLLSRLLHQNAPSLLLDELGTSTIKEVGNILASAYLSALGNLLHLTLIPSIPMLAYDMAGAVVDYILIELSASGDQALMVETEFHGENPAQEPIRGHFFLLPDPGSLNVFLKAAGMPS